jgi:hypothetical protein
MTTTTETAGNTFMKRVKGVKDLKEYIEWMSKMIVNVAHEFQHDLKQEKAVFRRTRICRGGPDISAEMCEIAHNDFVYHMTQLPQSSEYLQTTGILLGSIQQLENIRKMMVNNKQQKKTAIRRIRKIINMERSSTAAAAEENDMVMVELEPPATEDSPIIKELYGLIEMTKQNHRTISKRLIEEQVCPIMRALRIRHVLAFKLAAENTIGEIIHHAEKCRAFMLRCRWLALVEYCASSWWLETQKDPMDPSYYHVSAVIVGEEGEDDFKMFNPKKQYPAFLDQLMNAEIRIVVTGDDSRIRVAAYDLTRELSETILTEDAINAFENAQNDLLIRELQQQHQQQELYQQLQHQQEE